MAFNSLAQFVEILEDNGQLIRIDEFVDPVYEIAEITDRFCKQPNGGKALLFTNTGTDFPVLTNAFGSDERIALALGFLSPDEAAHEIESLFKLLTAPKPSLFDKVKMLPTLGKVARWMPKSISGRGACQEVIVSNPDLATLPVLKSWPFDGGPFVTLPMVNTKDPNTGIRNVGMYRMQVFDSKSTGMHWHRHKTGARHYEEYKKRGEKMPIAVVLGGDPAYTYAATAPLPDNIDEYLLAGFLRKKPVKLVKGITVDIEVPADADIVIEGYVDPQEELVWEGPFGDHTGFYSLADWYPRFHVTCITHKKNAIYPATIVGVPPMEDVYFAKVTERIFLSPIKIAMLPEVDDMYLPEEGVAHNIAIVKIKKTFPGQAYKVANALWGAGQMMFNKILLVVSSDIDIRNGADLAKVFEQNFNPGTDYYIGKGPLDVLDHASSTSGIGGKILLDLTEKLPEEKASDTYLYDCNPNKIDKLLKESELNLFGFSTALFNFSASVLLISVDKTLVSTVKEMANSVLSVLKDSLPKILLVVDKEISLNNLYLLLWYASGNTDPARDCFEYHNASGQSTLVVDGTRKSFASDRFPRNWPNVVRSSAKTIQTINSKWEMMRIGPLINSPSTNFDNMPFGNDAILK